MYVQMVLWATHQQTIKLFYPNGRSPLNLIFIKKSKFSRETYFWGNVYVNKQKNLLFGEDFSISAASVHIYFSTILARLLSIKSALSGSLIINIFWDELYALDPNDMDGALRHNEY